MSKGWITVAVVSDEIDANLKKGFLEDVGIRCIIEPSIFRPRSVVPIFNQFKINVLKEELELAKQILAELKE